MGGKPIRSNDSRRISVILSASGEGLSPSASRRARTNLSNELRHQVISRTAGRAGLVGVMKAQCWRYSAPEATQARRTAFSRSDRTIPVPEGGMCAAPSASSRAKRRLSWGLPGVTAGCPERPPARAATASSSRSLPLRAGSSGPWHLKQARARMGRTSRAKSGADGWARIVSKRVKNMGGHLTIGRELTVYRISRCHQRATQTAREW